MELVCELPLDQVLLGDAVRVMRMLPAASVDCVFADPPYNLQLRGELRRPDDSLVDGVDEEWDRFTDFAAYDAFTREWLGECRRLLRKDGTLWVIGSYHNIFRIGAILQELGFWVLNDIVWRKANPMPNFRGRRFTNAHETLIWAARGRESRHRFNYQAMKALNDDLQMRSDWFIPLCTGAERLRNDARAEAAPDPEAGGAAAPRAAGEHRAGRHRARPVPRHRHHGGGRPPAAPPLHRHRAASGLCRGGAGAAAAGPAERRPTRSPSRRGGGRRRACRSAAWWSAALLPPGTLLSDRTRRVQAVVVADGTIRVGTVQGSIHKVGAEVQHAPSCNGWTFWHIERDGALVAIDVLRAANAEAPDPPTAGMTEADRP